MEIHPSLRNFDFILAWEEFRDTFDWLNEAYWLHHFFVIGPERAILEIKKEIEIARRKS